MNLSQDRRGVVLFLVPALFGWVDLGVVVAARVALGSGQSVLAVLLSIAFVVTMAVLIYKDANARHLDGGSWLVFSLIVFLVGYPAYMNARGKRGAELGLGAGLLAMALLAAPFLLVVLGAGALTRMGTTSSTPDVPAVVPISTAKAAAHRDDVDEAICQAGVCKVGLIGEKAAATLADPKNAKLPVVMDSPTPAHLASLENAPGITKLSLGFGAVRSNPSDLSALAKLPNLVDVQVWQDDLPDLTSLSACEHLERLALDHGHRLTSLAGIEKLVHLRSLTLTIEHVSDLTPLGELVDLHDLTLEHGTGKDLSPLAKLHALHELQLGELQGSSLTPIGSLTQLTTLHFSGTGYTDLDALGKLTALQDLALPRELAAIPFVAAMKELRVLNAASLAHLKDITPLRGLPKVTRLELGGTAITDVTAVGTLTTLTLLTVDGTAVADVAPLARCSNLAVLGIEKTKVKSLAPLAGLSKLDVLNVSHLPGIDLTPLAKLPKLRTLTVSKAQIPDDAMDAFKAAQPHVKVSVQ